MMLKVLLPTKKLLDEETVRIVAEAADGYFCLLPRHIDCVAALVPGVLLFETPSGQERYAALDEAVLVKTGDRVMISARNGFAGDELGMLHRKVERDYLALEEKEQNARAAAARLEADLVRRLANYGRQGRY